MRTGAPWRDLPAAFGPRAKRAHAAAPLDGERAWQALRDRLGEDDEEGFIDSTALKAHKHARGAQKKAGSAGHRRGAGTKVHLLCDGLGYPLHFGLSAANESDFTHAPALLQKVSFGALAADRGYDSDALRELLRAQDCEPIIPGRANRKEPVLYDKHRFKARHLIENTFERLKEYRRLATRYEKTDRMLSALLSLGCFLLWLRF